MVRRLVIYSEIYHAGELVYIHMYSGRLLEDGPAVGRRLHVAREGGAVDLLGEWELAPKGEQLRVRELPARRLERMRAPRKCLGSA